MVAIQLNREPSLTQSSKSKRDFAAFFIIKMPEIISRDQNHVTVGAAVSNDVSKDITMLRVDPVTKYLLVDVTISSPTSANANQIATRDQNHVPVCMAWDETNGVLQEILTDSNGYLLCDIA